MLTEVKAYSSLPSAPILALSDTGRAETDFIQVTNINGLDPVKASVNTSPYALIDGAAYTGSSVLSRNIVLTLELNPDWDTWTYESLRRLVYSYFMPKQRVRLVFYSDDIVPVEIYGIVEDVSFNQFTKNPELNVSIICPYPYFTALTPTVVTGQSVREGGSVTSVTYDGNIETGFYLRVSYTSGADPTSIGIQIGDPNQSYFRVNAGVNVDQYFQIGSIPTLKFIENVDLNSGLILNLLSSIEEGSSWPTLLPGANDFSVITDDGVQDWELKYYERFGGL